MDAGRHPNIKLMAFSEVENVSGYVGNFKVTVRKKARYVDAIALQQLRRVREGLPGDASGRVPDGTVHPAGHLPAVPAGGAFGLPHRHGHVPRHQPHRLRQVRRGVREEGDRLRHAGRDRGAGRGRHRRGHGHRALRSHGPGRVRLHPVPERRHQHGVRAPDLRRRPHRGPPGAARRPHRRPSASASSSAWARARCGTAPATAATSAA